MIQNLTAKVRLYPTQEQAGMLKAVSKEYQRVCNIVSQWYFDSYFKPNRKEFQKEMYYPLRSNSELNSLMVQSTFRTVVARYKTVETQIKQHPYHYQDKNTGKWYKQYRNLGWLQKPINFKRPQADYVRQSNYSFVKNATQISMNVIGKRIKVDYDQTYINILINDQVKLGGAKLVHSQGKWYLHISYERECLDWTKDNNQHIVGIDRGLRQIMTIYDECGRTRFFNGERLAYQRHKYAYLRQKLQAAGTKSAKRHLKRLGQRENRWINDVNHCLSKTLVDHYGSNTLFVIENLQDVTFERKRATKSATHDLHSWGFFDLANKLIYKAHKQGSEVITVSAAYTSQRCPKCGQIRKNNRNHRLHLYKCGHCGFTTNDDRIGAMNLYDLGKQYIAGNEHPKFELTNVND